MLFKNEKEHSNQATIPIEEKLKNKEITFIADKTVPGSMPKATKRRMSSYSLAKLAPKAKL